MIIDLEIWPVNRAATRFAAGAPIGSVNNAANRGLDRRKAPQTSREPSGTATDSIELLSQTWQILSSLA